MIKRYANARLKRHARVAQRVKGTLDKPRLSIFRSNKSVYCQLIDDANGKTLAAVSGSGLELKGKLTKTERAAAVGQALADKALAQNIKTLVFDRSGYRYHGRVKAVADELRQKGLEF